MIIIVGESASGKSSLEKYLAESFGYKRTISYTTRPPREGEIDGVDYYFITEDEYVEKFNNGFFVETGAYNGWFYGTTKEQYSKDTVCVLTPHGLRQIKKSLDSNKLDIKSIYLKVPRKDRLIKSLQRGDDIDEAIRRNLSDVGQFDGIEDEVDYIITNDGYNKNTHDIAKEINDLFGKSKKRKTKCELVKKLAKNSKTKQNELILKCLDYYEETSVNNLSISQLDDFCSMMFAK